MTLRFSIQVSLVFLLVISVVLLHPWQIDWWLTADQRAEQLFRAGEYATAAPRFSDPLRQGVAWFRAGDFQAAAEAFARDGSAAGAYDRGTALVFLGKYDEAIKSFDRALELQPGWQVAIDNRSVAIARKQKLNKPNDGQEGTDGELKPDQIVFDNRPGKGGEKIEENGGEPMSDDALRALWLRRVQTKPADFLRARFSYQIATDKDGA